MMKLKIKAWGAPGLVAGLATGMVLAVIALVAASCSSEPAKEAAAGGPRVGAADRTRPNIVLLLGDDHAWMDFGFMGSGEVRTPHLDKLSQQGMLFTRGYVPTSLCRPSLMTLVTGLYPHQHGVTGNDPPGGSERDSMLRFIRARAPLAKLLGERGYISHQSGKWWEGANQEGGFTEGMTHGDPKKGGRHGDEGLKIGRQGVAQVLDFIDRSQGKPFFLWYAPMMPHTPHNPPARLLERYTAAGHRPEMAKYFAMCEWFDESCGAILEHLEKRGLSDNTMVIFLTDNGFRPSGKGAAYDERSKRSPYDSGIRTPVVIRWPGKMAPGRSNRPVSSVDFMPTVLRAAGAQVPQQLPGKDWMEEARAGAGVERRVFGEIFSHDLVDLNKPEKSLLSGWVAERRWKLIVSGSGPPELFDLIADPQEARNLAMENPEQVRRLKGELAAWWAPAAKIDDEHRHDAIGAAVSASSSAPGKPPERAVDGQSRDAAQCWQSGGPLPQWLKIDLGRVRKIERMKVLRWWGGQSGPAFQYRIEVSEDGTAWRTAADMSDNQRTSTEAGDDFPLSGVSGRFVRLTVTRGGKDAAAKITELKVWCGE